MLIRFESVVEKTNGVKGWVRNNHKWLLAFWATIMILSLFNLRMKIIPLHLYNNNIPDKHSFCVLTFNVNANDTVSFTRQFQDSLLAEIHRLKPDILCFQEISFENMDKIRMQHDSIYGECYSLKGDDILWRLRFYSHFPLRNFKRYYCEGCIDTLDLDSIELEEYHHMKLQMPIMSAEFELQPGKWVTLFSGHFRSSAYSTARRSMKEDSNWLKGIPLYFRNYKIGKRIRDYQARNVRRFIDEARAEGKTVIVAGDLNDWCGSTTLNTLMGEGDNALKDAWWEGGNGFGFTYQGWHLRFRLDHILYSDGLELQDVKVIDSNLSDHRPLIARFNIR